MKYDGKDSAEISCDEFLEMPNSSTNDPNGISAVFFAVAVAIFLV